MPEIIPTFQKVSFLFERTIPRHIEAYPSTPNFVGMYALFGAVDGVRPYPLAVDIEELALAEQLATARKLQQETDIDRYGYSDDVYINFPDGTNLRTYYGRSL